MVPTKRKTKRPLVCSFPPIAAADARVLVLGTVPSIASLAKQQYYGHPQNAFWPIMGRLFGAGRNCLTKSGKRILTEQGVAVWDVLRECYREGSLDTAIRSRIGIAQRLCAVLRERIRRSARSSSMATKRRRRFDGTCCRSVAKLNREFQLRALAVDQPGARGAELRAETGGLAGV